MFFILCANVLFLGLANCTLFNPISYDFKVHRLENCEEKEIFKISIVLLNFRVVKQNGVNLTFKGLIQVKEPIEINFRLSVHGMICNGPEDRTCKHSFVRKFGYICRKLHEQDRPWYAFIKKLKNCPIPVGYYDMGIINIDINALSYLPLVEGYWVIKVYGYSESNVVLCVYSEMELTLKTVE